MKNKYKLRTRIIVNNEDVLVTDIQYAENRDDAISKFEKRIVEFHNTNNIKYVDEVGCVILREDVNSYIEDWEDFDSTEV